MPSLGFHCENGYNTTETQKCKWKARKKPISGRWRGESEDRDYFMRRCDGGAEKEMRHGERQQRVGVD